jgi:peroxiredoxin
MNFETINTKSRKHYPSVATEYQAHITKGHLISIRKEMDNGGLDFSLFSDAKSFVVGDVVVYDSYNLIYTGTIIAIGPKTVTIDEDGCYEQQTEVVKRRMSLEDFARRNWNLDLDDVSSKNFETSQYI